MSAAPAPASREEIEGQWSGYWLDPGRQLSLAQPPGRLTGAILRRIGEKSRRDFVCLDLVRVDSDGGFVWLPRSEASRSEAGRSTYARSLRVLRCEPRRLVVWEGDVVFMYDAEYAASLQPNGIARLYGPEAQARADYDRPAVQLRLRRA